MKLLILLTLIMTSCGSVEMQSLREEFQGTGNDKAGESKDKKPKEDKEEVVTEDPVSDVSEEIEVVEAPPAPENCPEGARRGGYALGFFDGVEWVLGASNTDYEPLEINRENIRRTYPEVEILDGVECLVTGFAPSFAKVL